MKPEIIPESLLLHEDGSTVTAIEQIHAMPMMPRTFGVPYATPFVQSPFKSIIFCNGVKPIGKKKAPISAIYVMAKRFMLMMGPGGLQFFLQDAFYGDVSYSRLFEEKKKIAKEF
jgi:hypothetical protein